MVHVIDCATLSEAANTSNVALAGNRSDARIAFDASTFVLTPPPSNISVDSVAARTASVTLDSHAGFGWLKFTAYIDPSVKTQVIAAAAARCEHPHSIL